MNVSFDTQQPLIPALSSGRFLDPDSLLSHVGVLDGAVVADFGCGAGYFTVSAASLVGVDGVVYAVDVLDSALESVEGRARSFGLKNISYVRANLEIPGSTQISESSVDLVIVKNMLFQNDRRKSIVREAVRVLKRGGRLLVVEWRPRSQSVVGPEDQKRLSIDSVRTLFDEKLFVSVELIPAGDYHYAFVGIKK
ncbi:MAG: class I SAM-dependent methyltransferase [Candidatus Moranbacteria bacterium]|nr:class I SAM-dependent methyltransferase [Candidatus Moranbacteria bacterium]